MPIRSPRKVYLLEGFTKPTEGNPEGSSAVYVKMKKSIGDFLGMTPLPYNDPAWTGVFAGETGNGGATYRKRLGGYRAASYKFKAVSLFSITEYYLEKQTDGSYEYKTAAADFQSFSIGFPKGHSVSEVVTWIGNTDVVDQIEQIITPAGASIDISADSGLVTP